MLPDHVGLTKDQDSDVDDVSWENHGFVEMWGNAGGKLCHNRIGQGIDFFLLQTACNQQVRFFGFRESEVVIMAGQPSPP